MYIYVYMHTELPRMMFTKQVAGLWVICFLVAFLFPNWFIMCVYYFCKSKLDFWVKRAN